MGTGNVCGWNRQSISLFREKLGQFGLSDYHIMLEKFRVLRPKELLAMPADTLFLSNPVPISFSAPLHLLYLLYSGALAKKCIGFAGEEWAIFLAKWMNFGQDLTMEKKGIRMEKLITCNLYSSIAFFYSPFFSTQFHITCYSNLGQE